MKNWRGFSSDLCAANARQPGSERANGVRAPSIRATSSSRPNLAVQVTANTRVIAQQPDIECRWPDRSSRQATTPLPPLPSSIVPVTASRALAVVKGSTQSIAVTGFDKRPSPSISTSTVSPDAKKTGGRRAIPTPAGVPVAITSPGSRVISELM
jgi:hypothetical protein